MRMARFLDWIFPHRVGFRRLDAATDRLERALITRAERDDANEIQRIREKGY